MRLLLVSLIYLFTVSCFENLKTNIMKANISEKTILNIYQSGGDDIGYSIIVNNDTIFGSVKKIGIDNDGNFFLTDEVLSKSRILSVEEIDSINYFIKKLKIIEPSNEEAFGLGTITFTYYLENIKIYSFTSNYLLKEEGNNIIDDLKSFSKLLISFSPLEIPLQDYAIP